MAAIALNQKQFEELSQESKPLLVDYWAPWCGYCRRIAPAYEKVAESWGDEVIVAKINIDEESAVAIRERIEVIPTLVLYQNGNILGSIVAPESKAMIDQFIRNSLEK